MSVIQRTGQYGLYYGSDFNSSEALNQSQMSVNATYIANYLTAQNWTIKAISGLLGNLQAESSINPGRWQSDDVGNYSIGYGLVQWTPATNYTGWVSGDPSEMDNNLSRIIYEYQNGLQWIATNEFPISFDDFINSQNAPGYLAEAFLKNYERAGVQRLAERIEYANNWYTYLSGININPFPIGRRRRRKFKFILFKRRSFHGQR